jgi:hypothetical protein
MNAVIATIFAVEPVLTISIAALHGLRCWRAAPG